MKYKTYKHKTTGIVQSTLMSFNYRNVSHSYIGRSHWDSDSLANIDIQQILIYNKALSDNEMQTVLSRL